ncbi:Hypothetical predicted protein [Podarcis lilfordi]|uniref:Uncharacterized protein n=1 Tax=Podarcis lilfordi TaxID=74358 RepID=A0AA35LNK6_9SAUR|nr:Hypothetical predicted protein [Podarcis lilfordi]
MEVVIAVKREVYHPDSIPSILSLHARKKRRVAVHEQEAARGAGQPRVVELMLNDLWQHNLQLKSQVDSLVAALSEQCEMLQAERAEKASKLVAAHPSRFTGRSSDYMSFKTEILYLLDLKVAEFKSDQEKVAYIISYLDGRAKDCMVPLMVSCHQALSNLKSLVEIMDSIFFNPAHEIATSQQLLRLKQGTNTVGDY